MEPKLQRWIQRRGWDQASACYEEYWQQQLQPALDLLLATADLRSGEDVIDVACGTGLATLPAADCVAPGGRVLATDLAPNMIADLRATITRTDRSNVDLACCDAEDLAPPDRAFDVALCSLGLMYVPDPMAAVRELFRVVKPGGRVVVSVWGDRRNCGWAELFPIVSARVASDVCPMFFALGASGALTSALERVGFVDVDVTRLTTDLAYPTADAALGAAFRGGPVALAYSRFDEDTRRSAHDDYLASIAEFADRDGYSVPAEFVIASALRPETTDPNNQHNSQQEGNTP